MSKVGAILDKLLNESSLGDAQDQKRRLMSQLDKIHQLSYLITTGASKIEDKQIEKYVVSALNDLGKAGNSMKQAVKLAIQAERGA